jgi:hypothetical protein
MSIVLRRVSIIERDSAISRSPGSFGETGEEHLNILGLGN